MEKFESLKKTEEVLKKGLTIAGVVATMTEPVSADAVSPHTLRSEKDSHQSESINVKNQSIQSRIASLEQYIKSQNQAESMLDDPLHGYVVISESELYSYHAPFDSLHVDQQLEDYLVTDLNDTLPHANFYERATAMVNTVDKEYQLQRDGFTDPETKRTKTYVRPGTYIVTGFRMEENSAICTVTIISLDTKQETVVTVVKNKDDFLVNEKIRTEARQELIEKTRDIISAKEARGE